MASANRESLVGLTNNSSSDEDREIEEDFEFQEDDSKRGRGYAKKYFFEKEYSSLEEAKEELKSEKTWAWRQKKVEKRSKSTKHFYRCSKVKQRDKKQCSAGCIIVLPVDKTTVEVHRTLCAHDHITKKLKQY